MNFTHMLVGPDVHLTEKFALAASLIDALCFGVRDWRKLDGDFLVRVVTTAHDANFAPAMRITSPLAEFFNIEHDEVATADSTYDDDIMDLVKECRGRFVRLKGELCRLLKKAGLLYEHEKPFIALLDSIGVMIWNDEAAIDTEDKLGLLRQLTKFDHRWKHNWTERNRLMGVRTRSWRLESPWRSREDYLHRYGARCV